MSTRSLSAAHSCWANVRVISMPAASSERKLFPIPTIATRGALPLLLSCGRCRLSEVFQVFGNVLLSSIANQKILTECRVLPFQIGHGEAFRLAVHHTLPTVDAAVHAIIHHVPL